MTEKKEELNLHALQHQSHSVNAESVPQSGLASSNINPEFEQAKLKAKKSVHEYLSHFPRKTLRFTPKKKPISDDVIDYDMIINRNRIKLKVTLKEESEVCEYDYDLNRGILRIKNVEVEDYEYQPFYLQLADVFKALSELNGDYKVVN